MPRVTPIDSVLWSSGSVQLETDLWWSQTCGTNWAHSSVLPWNLRPASLGAFVMVCDDWSARSCWGRSHATVGTSVWTLMVYARAQLSRACGYPGAQNGPWFCTPLYL